eukprot:234169-Rhodomonas_salina.2
MSCMISTLRVGGIPPGAWLKHLHAVHLTAPHARSVVGSMQGLCVREFEESVTAGHSLHNTYRSRPEAPSSTTHACAPATASWPACSNAFTQPAHSSTRLPLMHCPFSLTRPQSKRPPARPHAPPTG